MPDKYIFLIRICELILAGLLSLISIISIIAKVITKKISKHCVYKEILMLLTGLLIFYVLFFAGEYSKLNLNQSTIDRILNLSIQSLDMSNFEKTDADIFENSNDDLIGDYVFEFKDSKVHGKISIHRCEDKSIYYGYYSPIRKLLTREYTSDKSYLLVDARESDRNFYQFPLIKSYINTVSLIKDGYLFEITYWELKNDASTIDTILDSIAN